MFYLTLPSNSSMEFFPDNKVSEFVTKLPREFNLDDVWEVGVAEIQYPHTWRNVLNSVNHWVRYQRDDQDATIVSLDPGHYDAPAIVLAYLEAKLKQQLRQNYLAKFYYNSITKLANITVGTGVHITLGEGLADLLGFSRKRFKSGEYEARHPIDINNGFYSIYLYCDVVEPRVVGNTLVPLLSILPIEGKDGDFVYRRFEKIHYHPIIRNNFSELHISLRTDQGEAVRFERGKVIVTLHFRKRKLTYL